MNCRINAYFPQSSHKDPLEVLDCGFQDLVEHLPVLLVPQELGLQRLDEEHHGLVYRGLQPVPDNIQDYILIITANL